MLTCLNYVFCPINIILYNNHFVMMKKASIHIYETEVVLKIVHSQVGMFDDDPY